MLKKHDHRLSSWLILAILIHGCSTPAPVRTPATEPQAPEPTFPVTVLGGDEQTFTPDISFKAAKPGGEFDVVVVGAGLAGLSAALYLSEHGKTVLVLEKEKEYGGLAAGGHTLEGAHYARGAAYWTDAYEEEEKILRHIGLGNFRKKFPIPEPIDSYFWNGKLYRGVWDEETLKELPASFEVFRHILKLANEQGLIPNQPIEEAPHLELDDITARAWMESMPEKVKTLTDPDSQRIAARLEKEIAEGKLDKSHPMKDLIDFLDLYCRSALGTTSDGVSGVAFANFYISEIDTRYTTPYGTGQAAVNMVARLRQAPKRVHLETSAPVGRITPRGKWVDVVFTKAGDIFTAQAKFVIFAAQLRIAPKLIDGFAQKAPEQVALINRLGYAHYSVHTVELKGHPYRETYDTWTRASDYSENDFTDVILGRWMDPEINGYQGMQDFSRDPKDDAGIVTIYHPLSLKWVGAGYTFDQSVGFAKTAVYRMLQLFDPMLKEKWGTHFEIQDVKTNRWPFSVHVAAPGHFRKDARILRRPFGRIFFGNNNLGTPAFEEALFRGHCAANNVLKAMDPKFVQEKWSQCPLEETHFENLFSR